MASLTHIMKDILHHGWEDMSSGVKWLVTLWPQSGHTERRAQLARSILFIESKTAAHGTVPPTFRMGLSYLVKPVCRHLHRHTRVFPRWFPSSQVESRLDYRGVQLLIIVPLPFFCEFHSIFPLTLNLCQAALVTCLSKQAACLSAMLAIRVCTLWEKGPCSSC